MVGGYNNNRRLALEKWLTPVALKNAWHVKSARRLLRAC